MGTEFVAELKTHVESGTRLRGDYWILLCIQYMSKRGVYANLTTPYKLQLEDFDAMKVSKHETMSFSWKT